MTVLSGFSATNFPLDVLYNAGIVYVASVARGVTKGEPKFTPNVAFDTIGFDGKYASLKGLDRRKHGDATIALTMMEIGDSTTGNQVSLFEPGATTATVSTTETITPKASGLLLTTGDYLVDLRIVWERGSAGSGNYFAVYFPFALCTKYGIEGKSTAEAMFPVEFATRIDGASGLTQAPYKLEYRTTLP